MLTARCEKVLKIVILKFNSNNVSLLVWSAWNSAAKMWIKKTKKRVPLNTSGVKKKKKNHFGETFLHFSTNFIQLWKEKSAILALSSAALIISLLFFLNLHLMFCTRVIWQSHVLLHSVGGWRAKTFHWAVKHPFKWQNLTVRTTESAPGFDQFSVRISYGACNQGYSLLS